MRHVRAMARARIHLTSLEGRALEGGTLPGFSSHRPIEGTVVPFERTPRSFSKGRSDPMNPILSRWEGRTVDGNPGGNRTGVDTLEEVRWRRRRSRSWRGSGPAFRG